MDIMDIQSWGWLVLAVISFIAAISVDGELRKEMNIGTVSVCIFSLVALYYSIMWICRNWIMWCM